MFLEPFEKHKEIQDLYTFELEAERKSFNAKGVAKILAIWENMRILDDYI